MRDTERGRDTGREEAGSLQGARCGTGSRDPSITPWAKGRCSTTEPPKCPIYAHFDYCFSYLPLKPYLWLFLKTFLFPMLLLFLSCLKVYVHLFKVRFMIIIFGIVDINQLISLGCNMLHKNLITIDVNSLAQWRTLSVRRYSQL